MNHNIQFDGLKSVLVDGKRHGIARVDAHVGEGGTTSVMVRLADTNNGAMLCFIYTPGKDEKR